MMIIRRNYSDYRFASKLVLVLLASVSLSLFYGNSNVGATDFKKVYQAARDLESIGQLLSSNEHYQDLRKLTGAFIKLPKSDVVSEHAAELRRVVDNIRTKTLAILANGKGDNFASNFKRGFMLFFSNMNDNFDPEIKTYSDGLNWLIANNQLSEPKVDCAMENLKSKHLSVIMFVLKTDLKHLLLDEIGLVERAIFSHLESQRFAIKNDFHNQSKLSQAQENALVDFYQKFKDTNETRVGEFLDHVINPGRLAIGRIMDSCSAVLENYPAWKQARANQDACNDVVIFKGKFVSDSDIEVMSNFCNQMIEG